MRGALFVGWVMLSVGAATGSARAYRTLSDTELCETEGCTDQQVVLTTLPLTLELNEAGSDDIVFERLEALTGGAVGGWAEPECTGFTVDYTGTTARGAIPNDGFNTIQFIEQGWVDMGFGEGSLAATRQELVVRQGRVVLTGGDIRLNGEQMWIASGTPSPGIGVADVVIAHETGHLLGLEHPCEPEPFDNAPSCDSIASEPTLMWFDQSVGPELTRDDEEGLCFLYPDGPCARCAADEVCAPDGSRCVLACPATPCSSREICEDGLCVPDLTAPDPDAGAEEDGGLNDEGEDGGAPPSRSGDIQREFELSSGCGCRLAPTAKETSRFPWGLAPVALALLLRCRFRRNRL